MQDKNARIHRKRLREFNENKEEQLSRFCITFASKSKLHSAKHSNEFDVLRSFAKTLYPKAVPLTPNLIYWN